MPYIGQGLSEGTRQLYTYTATANQSVFSASYTPGKVDVFQNGVLLFPNDYTATDGATITLSANASLNDEISIIAQDVFSVVGNVANNYLQAQGYGTGDVSNNYSTSAYVSNTSFEALKSNSLGRRNLIINGAMKVAQRGTSISGGTGRDSYGLDRFVFEGTNNPISAQVTHSNSQITDGNRNALKISTTGTAIGTAQVHQRIERETFRHTIGQTVTFSCLVKRNSSNVTGGTLRMIASVNANATYVLRDNPGIYPSHTVTETLVTGVQNIPTDYTRYTASFTMPAGANTTDILEIGLSFYLFSGAAATEDLFSISEMQLELGDIATPFEYRSYGEELALCQRYYCETRASVRGTASGGSQFYENQIYWPQEMRAAPATGLPNTSGVNISSLVIASPTQYGARFSLLVSGAGGFYALNKTVTADAEL